MLAVVGFLVFGFACFVVVVGLIVAGDDVVFGDLFSLGWLVEVVGVVVLEFAGLLGFRFRWGVRYGFGFCVVFVGVDRWFKCFGCGFGLV